MNNCLKNQQEELWSKCSERTIDRYMSKGSKINNKRTKYLSKFVKENLPDVCSAFEVGLMGGRNLMGLQKYNDIKILGGIDVCAAGVDAAKIHLPDGKFEHCSVYDMNCDEKFDMVFTMGVMIHIPPDGIDRAIEQIINKAKKYIIHCESLGKDFVLKGPEYLSPSKVSNKFQWSPNLLDRYLKLGLDVTQIVVPKEIYDIKDVKYLMLVKLPQ